MILSLICIYIHFLKEKGWKASHLQILLSSMFGTKKKLGLQIQMIVLDWNILPFTPSWVPLRFQGLIEILPP